MLDHKIAVKYLTPLTPKLLATECLVGKYLVRGSWCRKILDVRKGPTAKPSDKRPDYFVHVGTPEGGIAVTTFWGNPLVDELGKTVYDYYFVSDKPVAQEQTYAATHKNAEAPRVCAYCKYAATGLHRTLCYRTGKENPDVVKGYSVCPHFVMVEHPFFDDENP